MSVHCLGGRLQSDYALKCSEEATSTKSGALSSPANEFCAHLAALRGMATVSPHLKP